MSESPRPSMSPLLETSGEGEPTHDEDTSDVAALFQLRSGAKLLARLPSPPTLVIETSAVGGFDAAVQPTASLPSPPPLVVYGRGASAETPPGASAPEVEEEHEHDDGGLPLYVWGKRRRRTKAPPPPPASTEHPAAQPALAGMERRLPILCHNSLNNAVHQPNLANASVRRAPST